jgi:predicted PurR-regulated permease PerM
MTPPTLPKPFFAGLIVAILRIEGAVCWGVVMAVLSLLPAVGAALVWAPAAVILVIVGEWIQGLVLFSTLGGLSPVGITGFVLGPVIAALFIAVWHVYTEDRERGPESTFTRAHDELETGRSPGRAAIVRPAPLDTAGPNPRDLP